MKTDRKPTSHFNVCTRALACGRSLLSPLALAGLLSLATPLGAHNVDQRMNWMAFDEATLDMISDRADLNDFPLIRQNDLLGIVIKASPEPSGATTGVGGYVTFYPPEGVQITGASYAMRDQLSGDYVDTPMKGQAIIAIGDGSVGGDETSDLVGLTLGPNIVGQTESAVDNGGRHRGTLAGLYGDTGIFYSVDPDTAWQTWTGGAMENNRGETVTPANKWDANQLRAYGRKDETEIIDFDGRGSTPWGLGSPVAGPQSGYAWEFDGDYWDASGQSAADLRASIQMGPWQRIQYPGSQVAFDQPGLEDSDLGYAGVATESGAVVNTANPLPETLDLTDGTSPKAVRWSVGMLQTGQFEYVRVSVKVLADPGEPNGPFDPNGCFEAFAEVSGGDAAGEQGGKDHTWRYYDPTFAVLNPGSVVSAKSSQDVVKNGDTFHYEIEYVNASTVTLTDVVVTNTLPGEVDFISSTPPQDSGPNPLQWSIASLGPGETFTATVVVRAESSGVLAINRVEANNSQNCPAEAEEGTWFGENPILVPSISVDSENASPGDQVQYTLRVDNTGAGPSGDELVIDDVLPDPFTYVSLDSVMINGGNGMSDTTVDASDSGNPIFVVNRQINEQAYLDLTFTVQIAPDAAIGTYYNIFNITHSDPVLGKDATLSSGPQAPVTIGGASFGDTVFRDWDGDGIQDPEDEGIVGVVLQLDGNQITTTDANGIYVFNGLTPGSYNVAVIDTGSVLVGHSITTGLATQAVTLTANEENLGIDFGYQPGGPGVIGGVVFDDDGNDGTFQSGTDARLSNVSVSLYEDSDSDGEIDSEDYLVATTASDGSGNYEFSDLAEGLSYIVDVDENDADLVSHFSPNAYINTSDDPKGVGALSGNVLNCDFGFFELQPATIGGRVYLDDNGNGVYDAGEVPVVNPPMLLYRDIDNDGEGAANELVTQLTGDVAGVYSFTGLGPDRYIIDIDDSQVSVPGSYFSGVRSIDATLGVGQVVSDADFPYVTLLTKGVDRTAASAGDTITYTINVNYTGSDLVTGIIVEDLVPEGTTLVSVGQGGGVGNFTPTSGQNGVSNGLGTPTVVQASLVKDTWLDEDHDNDNYGSDSTLILDPRNDRAGRILMQFNLGSVPAGVTISRATLSLHQTSDESDATAESLEVRALTQSWVEDGSEDTANWKERLRRTDWNQDGGTINGLVYGTATAPLGSNQALDIDITPLVTAWVEGSLNNRGLLIKSVTESAGDHERHIFSSREGSNAPTLEIEYLVPSPAVTNELTVSPNTVAHGGNTTVTMTLESDEGLTDVVPGGLQLEGDPGVSVTLSDPTPASLDLNPGEPASVTWTVTADAGVSGGVIRFRGDAAESAVGGYVFPEAVSHTVLVTPPGAGASSDTVRWVLGSHTAGVSTSEGTVTASSGVAGESPGNPLSDPGTMTGLGDEGDVFFVQLTGTNSSSLWGTDLYTHDSLLRAAAVHAGAVSIGETAVVRVVIRPGQPAYVPSQRNGVSSQGWGSYNQSYQVQAASSPWSTIDALIPSKDNWLDQDKEDENNGIDENLILNPESNKRARPILEFDLGSIPSGATLLSASLQLYKHDDGGKAENETVEVRALTEAWNEGTRWGGNGDPSWDERSNGVSWSTLGGTYNSTVYATATVPDYKDVLVSWDVTSLVTDWMDGTLANNGLLLKVNNENRGGDYEHEFYSSEGSSPPRLVINYSTGLGGPVRSNAISVSPTVLNDGDTVQVQMTLTAAAGISNVAPQALTVTSEHGASATLVSGPTPASQTVDESNNGVYTWTYSVTAGTEPASLVFSGGASGDGGVTTYSAATSNSVIVVPSLAMQVQVNSPIEVGAVNNVASIFWGEDGVTVAATPSNEVTTVLSGAIGDFVWVDLNADGAYQPGSGEVPLAGVEVCVSNGSETYCDTSDSNGFYQVAGLDRNGGQPWTVTMNTATLPGGYLPTTPTTLQRVLATDTTIDATADFGVQTEPLTPGTINGRVWLDEDGDGTVDTGEGGVAGASIRLHWDGNNNGVIDALDVHFLTTTTDENGDYSFTGLPGADFLVEVDEDSSIDTGFGQMSLIGASMELSAGSNPVDVTLPNGGTENAADFTFRWGGSIGDYVWYDLNSNGTAESSPPDDGGVPDAVVLLYYDEDGDGVKAVDAPVLGFTTTDSLGAYTFDYLPPGTYVVEVDESTVVTPPSSLLPGAFDLMVSTTGKFHALNLLPKQAYTAADFGWVEACAVGDTVFEDLNANGTREAGEPGLPDVRVDLTGMDEFSVPVAAVTVTDLDGKYRFLVPPGAYEVAYDQADPDIPTTLVFSTTSTSISARVSSGMEFAEADFGLAEGGGITGKIYSDSDGDGAPLVGDAGIGGVTVSVFSSGGGAALGVSVTDSFGIYSFEGIPAGDFVVKVDNTTVPIAYTQSGDPDEVGLCLICDQEGSVSVPSGTTVTDVDFGYQHSGVVHQMLGTVFLDFNGDGVRGDPLVETGFADVQVNLDCGVDGSYSAFTDANGDWRVFGILSGGSCDITVDTSTLPDDGLVPTTPEVITHVDIIANHSNQDFGFWLQLGSIAGHVVEGDGNGLADGGEPPISGITLTVVHAGEDGLIGTGDDFAQDSVTGADGSYGINDLPKGLIRIIQKEHPDYVYLADADGGRADIITLTLNPAENKTDQDFEIQILPKADISGVVFSDDDGNGVQGFAESGIANVSVDLYADENGNNAVDSGDTLLGTEFSDGLGAYTFLQRLPGDYLLAVSDQQSVVADYVFTTTDPLDVTLAGVNYTAGAFGFQPPSASIGDLVWFDDDGDGVFDAGTESGVAEVTVDLYLDQDSDGVLDVTDTLISGAETDSNGAYDFLNLPAGDYLVMVTDLNKALTLYGQTAGGRPHAKSLAHAEDYNGADFGFMESPLIKAVDKTGALGGEILTYTISPDHDPAVHITNVVVSDMIPTGTTYVAGSATPTPASEGASITWNLGSTSSAAGAGSADVLGGVASVYALRGEAKKDFWAYNPVTDTWSALADTPENVHEGGGLTTDNVDRIWAIGGDGKKNFWRYTPSTDTWTVLADAPENVKQGGAVLYYNESVYAVRGEGKKDFWRYDVATDTWNLLTDAPENIFDGGSLAYAGGDSIYVSRGDGKKDFWRYDILTDSWTLLADAPENIKDGGALTYHNGDLYLLRGDNKKEIYRYDIASDVWSEAINFDENVEQGGALVSLSGTLYAFEGNGKHLWKYQEVTSDGTSGGTATGAAGESSANPLADSGDLQGIGAVGDTVFIQVTGADSSSIWGTDIYTDDSHLDAAAVHAGVLTIGETGVVKVNILAGQSSYSGTTRNGVTSSNWGSYSRSYEVLAPTAGDANSPGETSSNPLSDPGDLQGLGSNGDFFFIETTGANSASIWGTGIYTTDSVLAAAAVHSGALAIGETGVVQVQVLGAQTSFAASTQNGVTSTGWGADTAGYQVIPVGTGITTASWIQLADAPENVKWGGALTGIAVNQPVDVDIAAPALATDGDLVTVSVTLNSTVDIASILVSPPTAAGTNGTGATLNGGGDQVTAVTAGVPVVLNWTYEMTTGANIGSVVFSSGNIDGITPATVAVSNSTLVTPPLTFQVQVDDPVTAAVISNVASVEDSSGAMPETFSNVVTTTLSSAVVSGQVRFDVDGDGDPADNDPGIFSVTVELYTDVDGDGDATGESLLATVVTDQNGNYVFGESPRGRYVVVASDRPGTSSTYDSDGSLTDNQIGVTVIADLPGNDFLDASFTKPDSWNNWVSEFSSVLGSETGPADNPEGDIYENLLEYGLCLHPGTGLPGPGGFRVEAENEHIKLTFYRAAGGLTDVTYFVQGLAALPIIETETWDNLLEIPGSGTPPQGVTITDLGNGIEEVSVAAVDDLPPLSADNGYVRLEVKLDNGTLEASAYTRVHAWNEVTVEQGRFQTYSNPMLPEEVLSGVIDAITGTHGMEVTTSLGEAALGEILDLGNAAYYIEVIDGDLIGHRFDVSDADVGFLALEADDNLYSGPPHNSYDTGTSLPALLAGDQFILREHQTVDSLFPPTMPFTERPSSLDPNNPADRILFFDGGWETYWLFNNHGTGNAFWDLEGNAAFIDAGKRVVPPTEGIFLNVANQSITFLNIGIVRKNDFAVPLDVGHNFLAGGFPMDQGPAFRGMTVELFDGDPDPALSDSIFIWLGDVPGSEVDTYQGVYLLENAGITTPRWSYWEDTFLTVRDWDTSVFPKNRSSFLLRVNAAMPSYVMPLPWCIDLIGE